MNEVDKLARNIEKAHDFEVKEVWIEEEFFLCVRFRLEDYHDVCKIPVVMDLILDEFFDLHGYVHDITLQAASYRLAKKRTQY